MASKNRTFSMTKGAYGTQMGFNLYDALGKFTITGTVKIFAKLQGGSVNAINGANCNVAGPFTIEGIFSYINQTRLIAASFHLFYCPKATSEISPMRQEWCIFFSSRRDIGN